MGSPQSQSGNILYDSTSHQFLTEKADLPIKK